MLSWPGLYDGARSNPERERRPPEAKAAAVAVAGPRKKRRSGSIMAPTCRLTHKICASRTVLLFLCFTVVQCEARHEQQHQKIEFPAVPPWCKK